MLGNVITALAEKSNNPKKNVLVPYRESKLTCILQACVCVGARACVCLRACVSARVRASVCLSVCLKVCAFSLLSGFPLSFSLVCWSLRR